MSLTEQETAARMTAYYESCKSTDQTENVACDSNRPGCRDMARDCHQVLSEIETELNHILGISTEENADCKIKESRGDLADLQHSLSRMCSRLQEVHKKIVYVHEQIS